MTTEPFALQRLSTEDIPRRERMAFVHDFMAQHVWGGRRLLPTRPALRGTRTSRPAAAYSQARQPATGIGTGAISLPLTPAGDSAAGRPAGQLISLTSAPAETATAVKDDCGCEPGSSCCN